MCWQNVNSTLHAQPDNTYNLSGRIPSFHTYRETFQGPLVAERSLFTVYADSGFGSVLSDPAVMQPESQSRQGPWLPFITETRCLWWPRGETGRVEGRAGMKPTDLCPVSVTSTHWAWTRTKVSYTDMGYIIRAWRLAGAQHSWPGCLPPLFPQVSVRSWRLSIVLLRGWHNAHLSGSHTSSTFSVLTEPRGALNPIQS